MSEDDHTFTLSRHQVPAPPMDSVAWAIPGERCKLGAVIVDAAVVDGYVSNQGRWNDRP